MDKTILLKQLGKFFTDVTVPVKTSFNKCLEGNENFKQMLWFWCLIPNIVCMLILKCTLKYKFFNLVYFLYDVMCLYFILKAVQVHPEYNITKTNKLKEKEYVSGLSPEELKKYKKDQLKKVNKDFWQKLLLQKPWKNTEFYKIVILILLLLIIITFRNILR